MTIPKFANDKLAWRACRVCKRRVYHDAFVHVHDDKENLCEWLCPTCWLEVCAFAVAGGIADTR